MTEQSFISSVVSHVFRLKPGQDLKKELLFYCQLHHIHAACIMTCVGSLEKACLRMSGGKEVVVFKGPLEIVSATGTLSTDGIHLHISLSDSEGRVVGGHLMDGCLIHTTAEIVFFENSDLIFKREMDQQTGYKELIVKERV